MTSCLESRSEISFSVQTCFDGCVAPHALQAGAIVEEGVFVRNFNIRETSLRYSGDAEGEKFGRKIKADFLKTDPPDQLSVNCINCMADIACSPLLQARHGRRVQNSVAILDLGKIRQAMLGSVAVYAVYRPIPRQKTGEDGPTHPGNPCHFDIQCGDTGLAVDAQLRSCLRGDWIPSKIPNDAETAEKVKRDIAIHSEMIRFKFDVVESKVVRPSG